MPISWYEDYLLANAEVFVQGGIRAIKIQDETRETGPATQQTVARMSVLGRLFRRSFPDIHLGIIVQAHDAIAPLAIADAVDADFVRLKIFVGAAVNAEGMRQALSVEATDYRSLLERKDIQILADVHDRTCQPLSPVPHEAAALWAQNMGADALVLTGATFEDSLARVTAARNAGVSRPIVIGGSVTAQNIRQALQVADSVVVSTSLLKRGAKDDLVQWDVAEVEKLVAAVEADRPGTGGRP